MAIGAMTPVTITGTERAANIAVTMAAISAGMRRTVISLRGCAADVTTTAAAGGMTGLTVIMTVIGGAITTDNMRALSI
jgi:hypothetical protein